MYKIKSSKAQTQPGNHVWPKFEKLSVESIPSTSKHELKQSINKAKINIQKLEKNQKKFKKEQKKRIQKLKEKFSKYEEMVKYQKEHRPKYQKQCQEISALKRVVNKVIWFYLIRNKICLQCNFH